MATVIAQSRKEGYATHEECMQNIGAGASAPMSPGHAEAPPTPSSGQLLLSRYSAATVSDCGSS